MNITASISTDILAIIALCLAICLAKRNPIINNYKNKMYISVSVVTIILLVLEIITILLVLSTNNKLVVFHRIANIMGFSLSPVVPFIFLMLYDNNQKRIFNKCFLAIPLYLNAVICILSYSTGWIFFVDAQNQYLRGSIFILPMIISAFYFVMIMIAVKRNTDEYQIDNRNFLVLIIIMPMLGATLQIIFEDLLLIWGSMGISLLLYYILLRELQFKYDIQTGIKNRSAFEKEMEQYIKDDKNAAIVVLDINNLKKNNDSYGHKAGDEIIFYTAKSIQESFATIGKAFRIGGDEFCVICEEIKKESVDRGLEKLDNLLTKLNEKRTIKIEIAYGYAFYTKEETESVYSTFTQADKAMYEHKARLKSLCGRRIND
ncbi:GGDEF domain-containing protein [Alkaliphilus peptidifermentans]|uniref:Diguanylate cyclase (GGDEF) domain-containing protein n=1 Tax=Alkaliphilus peptidifermentans DSM 18978 TaxID=1120976 RepID=A0A1G5BR71_9FIRM|nr:GGDEF domain-containing protein [Alkaliphilus peptidifermentans]SCX92567.1 diguanylate cyclase (GGDEF) domain-containing protein [Alkaliphilus peptidifermentans DSM 18978]